VSLLLFWSVASAADSAEAERLREELVRLAERNTWTGVDRTYRALVDEGAALSSTEHLLGGQAALALGDPLLAWYRMRRAPQVTPSTPPGDAEASATASDEAGLISSRYGKVALCVGPKRLPVLVRSVMPFAQPERDAIKRVSDQLREGMCHRGLLPIGAYELDGQAFEVVPGDAWVVVDIGWD
jgi:hypothetical protein